MPWATAPMVVLSRSAVDSSSGCGCWWLVMTARHRTGPRLAAAETRDGANPKLRTLAQQMMTELQAQIEQLTALLAA